MGNMPNNATPSASRDQDSSGQLVQHWQLIAGIGLLFAWLLSFPLQGPLLFRLLAGQDIAPSRLIVWFLGGHLAGLAGTGLLGNRSPSTLRWCLFAVVPCSAISLALPNLPASSYPVLLAVAGMMAGVAVIGWGSLFAAGVSRRHRGRTFAAGAIVANLILYAITLLSGEAWVRPLVYAVGVLPLFMLLSLGYRPRAGGTTEEDQGFRLVRNVPYLLFVLGIYTVGGLMYGVIGSKAYAPAGALVAFGLVPYILFLFIAGPVADRLGRRLDAIAGAVAVGIGFMAVGLLQGTTQYLVVQTLLVGGYAFLDTFTWVIAADLGGRRRAPLSYALVLGANIAAILIGVLLAGTVARAAAGSELLSVSMAGLFSFASLGLVFAVRETLHKPSIPAAPAQSLDEVFKSAGLTAREVEIAHLLVEGISTGEILDRLVIAQPTLKSHLRSIYRKFDVPNRNGFTVAVMKATRRGGADKRRPAVAQE